MQPDQFGRLCHFFEHCHIIDAHIVIFHTFPFFKFYDGGKGGGERFANFFFYEKPPHFPLSGVGTSMCACVNDHIVRPFQKKNKQNYMADKRKVRGEKKIKVRWTIGALSLSVCH